MAGEDFALGWRPMGSQSMERTKKMTKFGQLLAATALALGTATAASAAVTLQDYQDKLLTSAADLADLCAAKPDDSIGTAALNFCHGYARGAVALQLQRDAASRRPMNLFCFPTPSPVPSTTLAAFAAWVKADPARGGLKPLDALFQFLNERFPCGK